MPLLINSLDVGTLGNTVCFCAQLGWCSLILETAVTKRWPVFILLECVALLLVESWVPYFSISLVLDLHFHFGGEHFLSCTF